jgi:hypothetical protein
MAKLIWRDVKRKSELLYPGMPVRVQFPNGYKEGELYTTPLEYGKTSFSVKLNNGSFIQITSLKEVQIQEALKR